jgi:UDP-3-O-[3-hydroxymyristoyl] glucosamine N-acyltransferase
MAVTLAELARRFGGRVNGNPTLVINGVAALDVAGPHDIAFVAHKKYLSHLIRTSAGAVILSETNADDYSGTALIVSDPQLCFARVSALLHTTGSFTPGIHTSAVVDAAAVISPAAYVGPHVTVDAGAIVADGAFLGPGCTIGKSVTIGTGTRLVAHVFVYDRCVIGNGCFLDAGVVIGGEGFGYARDGDKWVKVPQLGRVVVGDGVEIGANTTIDRGTLVDTVISNGVKLDNLIQIAHNVVVGEHVAIAACTGIAGSTRIGKRCTIGGQATILGHLEIADDVHITATSLVSSSITQPGTYSSSLKATVADDWRRNAARLHRLDDMADRLRRLEKELQSLNKEQKT